MSNWIGPMKHSFAEFRRRRVFRVAAAYAVAGWLLIQLGSATFEPIGLPPWSTRLLLVLLLSGFVLACALAWVYDIGVHGIERTPPVPGHRPRPANMPPSRELR